MSAESPRTGLIYGDGGEGLVFLERDYALDIANFRKALYKARTWGELKTAVSQERYEETVDAWVESQIDRSLSEGDPEDGDKPDAIPPGPDDAFDAEEIWGYADGDWPEFAPRMMDTWVDKEIIRHHGHYVFPTLNAEYPVIDRDNEKEAISLLEERGYACVRDDDAVWEAIWGG